MRVNRCAIEAKQRHAGLGAPQGSSVKLTPLRPRRVDPSLVGWGVDCQYVRIDSGAKHETEGSTTLSPQALHKRVIHAPQIQRSHLFRNGHIQDPEFSSRPWRYGTFVRSSTCTNPLFSSLFHLDHPVRARRLTCSDVYSGVPFRLFSFRRYYSCYTSANDANLSFDLLP